jgi:DNA invertase Pin-like site-specific DNA recombinase
MSTKPPVPAAQYLRASTDYQQYSLDNQAEVISRYAFEKGFTVVKTYSDAAKSGLNLKRRSGLKQLLKDVVEGNREYRAILVYDVSRWGRFQDADEAAHYEFLCKSTGVPVHYCAETFSNDNSIPGLIMKTLKRTMAGEYSRELSVKVRLGLAHLTRNGFKAGGPAIYGMRRMLLDSSGEPRRLLQDGERKCVANERVKLVPGPLHEIEIVRRIFREFAEEHRSLRSIAKRLNDEHIPFRTGGLWDANTVTRILRQPSYVGTLVWGRTTAFLGGRAKRNPPHDWVVHTNAFEPILDLDLFNRAQVVFSDLTRNITDEQMLDRLRTILRKEGKLTSEIIEKSRDCPGLTTYYKRIGGLLNAYDRLGYLRPELLATSTNRQRMMLIRAQLIKDLVTESGGQLEEFRPNRVFRALLKRVRTRQLISVVLVGYCSRSGRTPCWIVKPPMNERKRVTVLAFLNESNSQITHMRVVQQIPKRTMVMRVWGDNQWLSSGLPLEKAADLLRVIGMIRYTRSTVPS